MMSVISLTVLCCTDAAEYVASQVAIQQVVVEDALKDPRIWRRRDTHDAIQLLKNVQAELHKAFAVGLLSATSEVSLCDPSKAKH